MSSPDSRPERRPLYIAVVAGVSYGLLFRLMIGSPALSSMFSAMSVTFLFAMPFALGMVVVLLGSRQQRWGFGQSLLLPWAPALLCLGSALLLAWEGLICVILWVPIFLVMSSLGGVAAYLILLRLPPRLPVLGFCLIAPIVLGPFEQRLPTPLQIRTVANAIEIKADAPTIWRHIERVRLIEPHEQRVNWTQRMGFPRPLEATLSRPGVGGVRRASFAGGVVFWETVTDWQPDHRLSFTIKADTESIPAATLDEHVTIGGPYFDVLNGTYEIEVLGPRRAILHLSSQHRLSTHFNFYAARWADFIMSDVQENILQVIKRRCEDAGAAQPAAR